MACLRTALIAVGLALLETSQASALCIYRGQMYAKTTLPQEFSDSNFVVRVRVVAADNHWSDEDESWTLYHLRVLQTFKGEPVVNLKMFTTRDSGGFYLDKGMSANLGGEYLLFLDPASFPANLPTAALGSTEVNYNCGQSRAWASVSEAARRNLIDLASARTPYSH